MRQRRERPKIIKIDKKVEEKVSSISIRGHIDENPIEELTQKYGSPLFVFSQPIIKDIYQKAYNAFSNRYPLVEFSWSYKTNYLKAVCQSFHNLGATAEVVSEFEYEKAKALGIKGKDIIFNGPYKPYNILKIAVQDGVRIHIDHLDEMELLEQIAQELDMVIPVAIRLNMSTDSIFSKWDRFGFNIESDEALNAVKRIKKNGLLRLNGLHSHIGTFMLDVNAYKVQTTKMAKFLNMLTKEFDFTIEYIDVGGGFASMNGLKGVDEEPSKIVPSIESYAEAITTALIETLDPSNSPKLILELGRYLIDEAGFLITSVVASKHTHNRRAYVVDAGINLLYTHQWYTPKIELSKQIETEMKESTLYGPLCMNIDIIRETIALPKLEVSSKLIISPVGAYNVTKWMQFIQYRPAIIMTFSDGTSEIIRDNENLDYVEKLEKVPSRLEIKGRKSE
jgi:diaminopimelate decarboxylase